MTTCIVCDQEMPQDDNACSRCGEPIHAHCLEAGCPSCEEIDAVFHSKEPTPPTIPKKTLPRCIECNKEMVEINKCPKCGEPIHTDCLDHEGCPECEEIAEELAGMQPPRKNVVPPPKKKPEPLSFAKTESIPRPTKNDIPDPPPIKLPSKNFRDPEPKDEVVYQEGSWRVGMGIKVTVRASFKHDPNGFRGFGNDEEEALADLKHYAFGAQQKKKI